jgi:hypothetical protein
MLWKRNETGPFSRAKERRGWYQRLSHVEIILLPARNTQDPKNKL